MPLFFALIALVAAVLTTLPGTADAQDGRYGDWTVACAEALCTASAAAGQAGVHISRSYSAQQRDNEEDGWWAVSFDAPGSPGKAKIALKPGGGAPLFLDENYGLRRFGTDSAPYLADEAALMTVVRDLAAVTRLLISFNERYEIDTKDPDVSWHELPVAGLKQALDAIDAKQKPARAPRLADMPAWLKPTNPPGEAPELPIEVKRAHFHSGGCHPVRADNPQDVVAFESHRLSDTETLYLIACNLYAYNSDARAYIAEVSEGKVVRIETVAVPVNNETGRGASTYIAMGTFDPATGRLFSYHKGRGLGDCGGSETWRHNGYQGFILVEARFKECGDSADIDPNSEIPEWPVVYRLGLEDVSVLNSAAGK